MRARCKLVRQNAVPGNAPHIASLFTQRVLHEHRVIIQELLHLMPIEGSRVCEIRIQRIGAADPACQELERTLRLCEVFKDGGQLVGSLGLCRAMLSHLISPMSQLGELLEEPLLFARQLLVYTCSNIDRRLVNQIHHCSCPGTLTDRKRLAQMTCRALVIPVGQPHQDVDAQIVGSAPHRQIRGSQLRILDSAAKPLYVLD